MSIASDLNALGFAIVPLLLHASSRSTSDRRRVLHIEFAGFSLPQPLDWQETPA